MTRGSEQFQALEDAWRKRVESARQRYLATASLPGETGNRELRRAARAEFMRVLRIFRDLIMQGKIPPEDEKES